MADPDAYVALITSLPGSERLFVAKVPPLSRIRLDRRLRALSPEDANTLRILEDVLSWDAYATDATDAEVFERGRQALKDVSQPTLRSLLEQRLEMRTAMAAIRLRLAGQSSPGTHWGFGRFRNQIKTHWNDPGFGLDRVYPWIKDAQNLAQSHDALGLERLVLEQSYRLMQRHAAAHHFDFEAVAIYVLVWNIFDRWAHSNAEAASRRFTALTQAALADHPELRTEI